MRAAQEKTVNKDRALSSDVQRPRPAPRGRRQNRRVPGELSVPAPPSRGRGCGEMSEDTRATGGLTEKMSLAESDGDASAMSDVFDDGDRAEMEDDADADIMSIGGDVLDRDDDDVIDNNAFQDAVAGEDGSGDDDDERDIEEEDGGMPMQIDLPDVAPRRYGTRSTNASKHPGLIDRDSDDERRIKRAGGKSSESRSTKVKLTEVELKAKAQRIAALEDKMRLTEINKDATATRPPPGRITKKVERPVAPAKRGSRLAKNPTTPTVVSRGPVEQSIDETDELDNSDVDVGPVKPVKVKGAKGAKAKKDKREIRSLIDSARSTPAKTPVARGSKRKSINLSETLIVLSDDEQSRLPPTKRHKPPQAGLLPSATVKSRSPSNTGLQLWNKARATAAPQYTIKIDSDIFTNDYGGYEDEDDSLEAASQPKISMKTAAKTQKPITGIVYNNPTIKLERAEASASANTRHRPSTHDIPLKHRALWHAGVLPHFREFIGTLENPWNLNDPTIILELQNSYDYAINDGYTILAMDPFYLVAFQRLYEWRGRFAATAIAAVTAFWDTEDSVQLYPKPENRADYVAFLLGPDSNMGYLWGSIEDQVDETGVLVKSYRRPFQSSFVLGTLAAHLLSTDGLPDDAMLPDPPRGALALASASVERALGFWVTGSYVAPRKQFDEFSELKWGAKTTAHIPNIAKIGERTWDDIIAGARKIADEKPKTRPTAAPRTYHDVDALSAARTMVFETI